MQELLIWLRQKTTPRFTPNLSPLNSAEYLSFAVAPFAAVLLWVALAMVAYTMQPDLNVDLALVKMGTVLTLGLYLPFCLPAILLYRYWRRRGHNCFLYLVLLSALWGLASVLFILDAAEVESQLSESGLATLLQGMAGGVLVGYTLAAGTQWARGEQQCPFGSERY